jgi:hypothetical protein
MTLQSSGAISLGDVNVELGRSSTANISLGETAVRTLAGVSSGPISLSQLYGKSNGPTFTPDGGPSAAEQVVINVSDPTFATITITCSETAVWTWTRSPNIGTCNVASGGSATSITMGLTPAPVTGAYRSTAYTLSATAGGITRYWYITLGAGP